MTDDEQVIIDQHNLRPGKRGTLLSEYGSPVVYRDARNRWWYASGSSETHASRLDALRAYAAAMEEDEGEE